MNNNYQANVISRSVVLDQIIENIKNGKSSKLLGVVGMGMTYILKTVHSYFSLKGLCNDLGISFYLSNDYDFSSFKHSISRQMKGYGIQDYEVPNENLMIITERMADILIPPDSDKKLVFLFDNFHRYFAKTEEVSDTDNTILTIFNLNKIRNINDSPDSKVVFIVTYNYPIEPFLGTDWYLNNLITVPVELLSEKEELTFIKNRQKTYKSLNDDSVLEKVRYYGGRYPAILNKAVKTNLDDRREVQNLKEWIGHRYIEIKRNFEKYGPMSNKPDSYINLLLEVVGKPGTNKDQLPELPAQYCDLDQTGNTVTVRLFSKHFEDYLRGNVVLEPGNRITWLHLSDLHYYEEKTGWNAEHILETLIEDLKQLEEKHQLAPDMIFFTGDLAFGQVNDASGSLKKQYEGANEFLEKIRNSFANPIPRENVFLVPGNHDVNRDAVSRATQKLLADVTSEEEITRMIKDVDQDWKDSFRRLEDYMEFLENYGYNHLLEDKDRLIYAITRDFKGIRIGIGGFNTAWSCLDDKEKGKLWMGAKWQLNQIRSALKNADISIVLLHHPPNWFVEKEDKSFDIKLQEIFTFSLHGHEHHKWVEQSSGSGNLKISAGACYESSEGNNGYNIVRLNQDTQEGEVWLRTYDDEGMGGWIPKIIRKKTNTRGVWPLKDLAWMQKIKKRKLIDVDIHEIDTPVKKLLTKDESSTLEFKSSLRWDYRKEEVGNHIEQAVLKSISALSNYEGGTLLIGIDDKRNILGLKPDYRSLNGGRDEFERHLRNLIISEFGKVFATKNVSISFHQVGENDISQVDVVKGDKPIYLEITNKHGAKTKKFYVRSGNTSQEIGIDEVYHYIKGRFKNTNHNKT